MDHLLSRLKINYPIELPPTDTQHNLLSQTTLFGDDLYRSSLGGGVDVHILPVCAAIKCLPYLIAASNNSTRPETTNIRRIFEPFSADVDDTSLLLLSIRRCHFVRNFSAAASRHHFDFIEMAEGDSGALRRAKISRRQSVASTFF